MTTTSAGVTVEDRGSVRLLFMDRAPANSLSGVLLEALRAELGKAELDASVRAVVLGTRQPKYFSSGLDLDDLFSPEPGARSGLFKKLIAAHRAFADFPKPAVAAIEGYALLGGYILSLGCDYRFIARENGRVALSEVRLGLTPTQALIRLVASLSSRPGLVKDLVLGGRTLKAEEAYEAGLVDRVYGAAEVLEASVKEAERLAKLPPKAFASVKRSYHRTLLPPEVWDEAMAEFQELLAGGEAEEGLSAIREKRKPRWEAA